MVRVVVVVVIGVVVAIVVEVVLVLVVTFAQPHFQHLPYILSYVITLKLNLIMTPLTGPCSCDHSIGCEVVVSQGNEIFFFLGGGRGQRRMFEVILKAAPVQIVAVTVLSSRSSCRSRTVSVKDLIITTFFLFFADVNECHPDVKGSCNHLCVNSQGSYYCKCPNGFQMYKDNKNCKCPKGFRESVNGTMCLGK